MSITLKKLLKIFGVFISVIFLFALISIVGAHLIVRSSTGVVDDSASTSVNAILVLGASVLRNGKPSDILADRLDTARELLEAGRAPVLILSGDDGQADYDEVNVMKQYLLDKGVPGEKLFLDHAGFDTYDSLYRARDIFGVHKLIVVTQNFHLPRALYIAKALGLEASGVSADKHTYRGIERFVLREWLADVKAVLDVMRRAKPKYLGNPILLDQSGEVTWD